MKNIVIALLATILVLTFVNLLAGLGVFKGGDQHITYDYRALSAVEMDAIGFRAIAKEEGLEENENGEITFPQAMIDRISKNAMLPRTILEVEKDGGWSFVAVTQDNFYIFRRPGSGEAVYTPLPAPTQPEAGGAAEAAPATGQ